MLECCYSKPDGCATTTRTFDIESRMAGRKRTGRATAVAVRAGPAGNPATSRDRDRDSARCRAHGRSIVERGGLPRFALFLCVLMCWGHLQSVAAQEHTAALDVDLDAANADPSGIWSDGTTLWVADKDAYKIFAYELATGERDPSRDFNTLEAAENEYPEGIWSDGTTMWVVDDRESKIFAYELATGERDPSRDLDEELLRAADHRAPTGLWSDGATLWVVSGFPEDKVFAYDLAAKRRDPAKDFDTLEAAGQVSPRGLWSDGATLWVTDVFVDDVFAYDLTTKERDPAKDLQGDILDAAGNGSAQYLWSDGTTLWVLDDRREKLFAYDPTRKGSVSAAAADEPERPGVTYAGTHSAGGEVTISVAEEEASITLDGFDVSGDSCSFSFQGQTTISGIPISDGRFSARQPPLFLGFSLEMEGAFRGSTVTGSITVSPSPDCEVSASFTVSRQ